MRRSGGGLLLPRLVPVGDPELDERIGGMLEPLDGDEAPVPPAIEPELRLMLLARLVQLHLGADAAEALRLAGDLARTLDQLLIEEVEPARLGAFRRRPAGAFAALAEVARPAPADPARLAASCCATAASSTSPTAATACSARWRGAGGSGRRPASSAPRASPPARPRWRGCSASSPGWRGDGRAARRSISNCRDEEWDALGPHEPDQATAGGAVDRDPSAIPPEAAARPDERRPRRGRALALGRRPATRRRRAAARSPTPWRRPPFTEKWQELKPAERRLTGVRALELADPAEEAQAIALALREALEEPGRTAALVTPDRALARRVSAHLRRWGVEADDSAGPAARADAAGHLAARRRRRPRPSGSRRCRCSPCSSIPW